MGNLISLYLELITSSIKFSSIMYLLYVHTAITNPTSTLPKTTPTYALMHTMKSNLSTFQRWIAAS